ncbi:uncharacterized protein BDW70DRAFT_19417 [Aspergillus foveolatus]|uniref:uncharacterized protein n=1 Tax=Aspergillus foveolatus TaxID=210207 RepID=UPI003CCD0A13
MILKMASFVAKSSYPVSSRTLGYNTFGLGKTMLLVFTAEKMHRSTTACHFREIVASERVLDLVMVDQRVFDAKKGIISDERRSD